MALRVWHGEAWKRDASVHAASSLRECFRCSRHHQTLDHLTFELGCGPAFSRGAQAFGLRLGLQSCPSLSDSKAPSFAAVGSPALLSAGHYSGPVDSSNKRPLTIAYAYPTALVGSSGKCCPIRGLPLTISSPYMRPKQKTVGRHSWTWSKGCQDGFPGDRAERQGAH